VAPDVTSLGKHQEGEADQSECEKYGDVVATPVTQTIGCKAASRPEPRGEPAGLGIAISEHHKSTEHRVDPERDEDNAEEGTQRTVKLH